MDELINEEHPLFPFYVAKDCLMRIKSTPIPHLDLLGNLRMRMQGLSIKPYTLLSRMLVALPRNWPGYSGNLEYPIPDKLLGARLGYLRRQQRMAGWWDGRYGRRQRDLIQYMIQWIDEQIEEYYNDPDSI